MRALDRIDAHLAVRSLGPRPEILAKADLGDRLVQEVQRHARDAGTLRRTLLPVALRKIPPDVAHTIIAALPSLPPDPSAFFVIASGHPDPDIIAPALHTNADLALAVALKRCADDNEPIRQRCTSLQRVLRGKTWNDLEPIMAILNTDSDALIARLAHPDYKEALHQTLDRRASLPPEVAVPTVVALHRWITEDAAAQGGGADVAHAIAHALHAHGNVFLALTDAVGDDRLRTALLPLPEKAAAAHALRDAAHDDPPTAHALAHALRDRSWSDAIRWLLAMPPNHAVAILCAMDDAVRCAIIDEIAAASPNAISLLAPDPIAALVRAGWDALSCEARQLLHTHPPFADLPPTNENVGARIYRRRR